MGMAAGSSLYYSRFLVAWLLRSVGRVGSAFPEVWLHTSSDTEKICRSQAREMTSLQSLPTDAWAVIFRHFDEAFLTAQFDALCDAGVFDQMCRLDTFWGIMGKLEPCNPRRETPMFDAFPEVLMLRDCRDRLMEMGLSSESAARLSGNSNGSLDLAIQMLGWNQ